MDFYKKSMEAQIKEAESSSQPTIEQTPRMTSYDRLRLIEAMYSDRAKPKLVSTQAVLSRTQLDARKSKVIAATYFETVSQVFNDVKWIPSLQVLPNLHHKLSTERDLKLLEYRCTPEAAKTAYNTMRKLLVDIMNKYEESGNDSGQRALTADDVGTKESIEVMEGDDKQNDRKSTRLNSSH